MLGPGTLLDRRYRLVRRLGGGGMGEVWRAEDVVLGREVAVKVLLPSLMEDPGFETRFRNEARAMASLSHPGVVDVYDYGACPIDDGGQVSYLVMECIDGESLDKTLRRGPLPPGEVMRLVWEVADALAAAHERGIVHRDVKPGNLMIRADGRYALTDFGIARSLSTTGITTHGMVLGSVGYAAPEQLSGGTITPAADIYALGVVAYQCLAGRPPFEAETPVQLIFKHLNAEVPPLPETVPAGPRAVVERALLKEPSARWASASEMAAAARRAAAEPGTVPSAGAVRATAAQPAPATVPRAVDSRTVPGAPAVGGAGRGRRTTVAAVAAGLAVLASLGVGAAVWLQEPEAPVSTPRTKVVEQETTPEAEPTVSESRRPSVAPSRERPADPVTPTPSRSVTPTQEPSTSIPEPEPEPSGEPEPEPTVSERPTQQLPSERPTRQDPPPSDPEEPSFPPEPSEEPSSDAQGRKPWDRVQCVTTPCP